MPGKAYRSLQNPRAYERIKEKCVQAGKGEKACKTMAARISNAQAPGHKVKRK